MAASTAMNRVGASALQTVCRIQRRHPWRPLLTHQQQSQRHSFHHGRSLRSDADDLPKPPQPSTPTTSQAPAASSESTTPPASKDEQASEENRDSQRATEGAPKEAFISEDTLSDAFSASFVPRSMLEDISRNVDKALKSLPEEILKDIPEDLKNIPKDIFKPAPKQERSHFFFDEDMPLTPEQQAEADEISQNPPAELRPLINALNAQFQAADLQLEELLSTKSTRYQALEEPPLTPQQQGLMSMGEPIAEQFPDEPFEGDEINSLAHDQLDEQRDLREYMRIITWEMPKLSQLARPYEPPSSDRPLRFRFTSYMGESHPSENKVVVEFCTSDLPLAPKQRLKLVKLAGPRYDPQTDAIKLSCESFQSQAQNKRYLGDLIGSLMRAARGEGNSPEAKDSFADVPVDFRHVKWNKRLEYPESWKLTQSRRKALAERRAALALKERQRTEEGENVDGVKVVEESFVLFKPALEQQKDSRKRIAPASPRGKRSGKLV